VVICLEQGADRLHNYGPADATASQNTIISPQVIKARLLSSLSTNSVNADGNVRIMFKNINMNNDKWDKHCSYDTI